MSTVVDFNRPNHKLNVTLGPEETLGERGVRLFKDVTLFLLAVTFVVLITWLCYQTLISHTSTADEKKWAMSFLSGSAGGLIGYLIRK